MRSRAVRVLGVACCLFAFGRSAAAQSASPQQGVSVTIVDSGQTPTPGPTSTPFVTCLQTRDADNHPQDTFAEREPMRVFLAAGCAESHEVDIEIDVESSPVLLTHMDADAAGGFLTDAIHLPAAVLAGPHDVVVKTIEHTYRVPITVTAAASSSLGIFRTRERRSCASSCSESVSPSSVPA
jgi:hypothetical protein